MTHIIFRTDISLEAGTGHLMRSLNLAGNLKERGVDISFITTELPDFFSRLLKDKHIEHYQLTTKNLSQETEEVLTFLKKFKTKPNWVVVDHYQLDERWERAVRPWVEQIAVIDDLANRRHDCDLLIDPNVRKNGENVYRPLIPASCKLLLGPRFALLSPTFAKKRKQIFQRKGEVQEVLVSFGGSDPANAAERTVNAFASSRFDGILNVVIGKLNPSIKQIEKKLALIKNAKLHIQTDQMAELMAKSDLAIGAGGTELWERCCLGLPSIVMATNPNQVGQLEALAKVGAIFYLGESTEISEDRISKAFEVLRANSYWLGHSSAAAMNLVDGKGAYRVASWLIKQNLKVRKASAADSEKIFKWRNAPEIRSYSFDHSPIIKEEHEVWFRNALASKDRILLIVEHQSEAIAVLRYDLKDSDAIVSIYLVEGHHGFGYGPVVLEIGSQWLAKEYPGIEIITGKILPFNKVSELALLEAGFEHRYTELKKTVKAAASKPKTGRGIKLLCLGCKEGSIVDYLKSTSAEVIVTEEPITLEMVNKLNPSFIISYNYRYIISKDVVNAYRYKIINLHCSFLPWNRGADPNFWSFIEGTPKGVTIHYIDEGVDTGEIIAQKEIVFAHSETLKTSYDKLQHELQNLFIEWWPRIISGACAKNRQSGTGTSHRLKDKEPLLHLIKKGWDTPTSVLENYGKKLTFAKD